MVGYEYAKASFFEVGYLDFDVFDGDGVDSGKRFIK